MGTTTILLHSALALAPVDDGQDGPWRMVELDNGIRVTTVHAEHADKQVTFTLLPLGLLDDTARRAQFAHLSEHLLVRSSDPDVEELEVDGILVNGETTALTMRLDTIAPTERWREAQTRHARWLMAREVDGAVLEREKGRIAQELESTVASGFTHKWAQVAWNQVVRHGAEHVRARGDVEAATVAQAEAYLAEWIRPGPGVHVVSVGPISPDEVHAAMVEDFGPLKSVRPGSPGPSLEAEDVLAAGDRSATWDLSSAHYMEWYPLPDEVAADRAAADALALLLNARLGQTGALGQLGAQALVSADLVTPEGRWLLVSVSLRDAARVDDLRPIIDRVVSGLASAPERALIIGQMANQFAEWPDFAQLRQQLAGRPGTDWIEAQQALWLLYAELNTELSRVDLAAAYRAMDPASLSALAEDVIAPGKRSTLLLVPRA